MWSTDPTRGQCSLASSAGLRCELRGELDDPFWVLDGRDRIGIDPERLDDCTHELFPNGWDDL